MVSFSFLGGGWGWYLCRREKISNYFQGNLSGKKLAVWGLAFKPNTDDIREAPALYMIDALLEAGATVSAFDPEAMPNVKQLLGDKINFTDNQYEALVNADALIIATEWNEFRGLDLAKLARKMATPQMADLRNIYDPAEVRAKGFLYAGVGRA